MVTDTAPVARAPKGGVPIVEAAPMIGYASETLRKMMWSADPPPPLFKWRGHWYAVPSELRRWAQDRDGIAS